MCGMVGFVGTGDEKTLQRMRDTLIHRGPDGEGVYIDSAEQVFLGHRRLAIVDIKDGHQPMRDKSDSIVVVFNGEIYNHHALRQKLINHGHHFHTHHSDTEVLIHGYKQWGENLPLYLDGMFAFAIYDKVKKIIFLARDPFGKKPLYYFFQNNIFAFSSELKAFFAHPQYTRRLNVLSLKKYFAYGFLPAPHCQYHDTYKLPGGHTLVFDLLTKKITQKKYWEFVIEPDDAYLIRNENDIADELIHLLDNAVKKRLMSDVPLGILLSGGIDSSTILAMTLRHRPHQAIHTFAIGFREKSFDESAHARHVAKFFNVTHHEKVFDYAAYQHVLTKVLNYLDEPLGDASILPTYLACEFAREKITVALAGDGGDELFAGYDPFRVLNLASIYEKMIPNWLHQTFVRLADWLPISHQNMSFNFKIRQTLRGLSCPRPCWQAAFLAPLTRNEIQELFAEPVLLEELYDEAFTLWQKTKSDNLLDKSLTFYTKMYLQDNILTKVDRASMMTSLECRAPFLDKQLVDFARKLPPHLKYQKGTSKYILKKALKNILPITPLKRRKKGFGVPISAWLKTHPNTFPFKPIKYCNQDFVTHCLQQHQMKKADHRLFLWSWLVASSQINHIF